MAEQWDYSLVLFIQTGEGKGGLANKDITINRRIDSFEVRDDIVRGVTEKLFPDGLPDLPKHVQPVVLIHWTLVTARRGPGVEPLKAEDNGSDLA